MAKQYIVNITNGVGTEEITNGQYTVTANATGYDNSSIDPTTLTINDETDEYSLTIGATGTLTVHVSDDGTTTGEPIVGAIFYRCDASGTTYGDPVTSGDNGNAIFEHIPFSTQGDAPTVYYKQTSSDDSHNFDPSPHELTLDKQTVTEEVLNEPAVTKTIKLTDSNYAGLPIDVATITLN